VEAEVEPIPTEALEVLEEVVLVQRVEQDLRQLLIQVVVEEEEIKVLLILVEQVDQEL
tara:strand:- start:123 stop:296 length:174 start_codon:yes stop_codon:yes gene_type:complete